NTACWRRSPPRSFGSTSSRGATPARTQLRSRPYSPGASSSTPPASRSNPKMYGANRSACSAAWPRLAVVSTRPARPHCVRTPTPLSRRVVRGDGEDVLPELLDLHRPHPRDLNELLWAGGHALRNGQQRGIREHHIRRHAYGLRGLQPPLAQLPDDHLVGFQRVLPAAAEDLRLRSGQGRAADSTGVLRGARFPTTSRLVQIDGQFAVVLVLPRHQVVEEAGPHPGLLAALLPGEGPGEVKVLAGAGDADVEQAAFLLDRVGRTRALEGVVDREHALVEADEEDGVPLQALGHVDADQGHTLHLRWVLGAHPFLEHADDSEVADLRVRGEDLLDQLHQGVEGLPALAFLRTAGLGGGEAHRGECRLRGVEDLLPGLRAGALCSSSPARLTGRLAAKAARALR